MKHYLPWSLIVMILPVWIGCQEKLPEGLPKLIPVTLTFTQEGQPLADALITLSSDSSQGWAIGGTTDANGVIVLRTHGKYLGVPAGNWKIIVKKQKEEGGPSAEAPADIEALKKWEEERAKVKYFSVIEQIYCNLKTTPLILTVDNKPIVQTFDVGKAVKIEIKKKSPI